MVTSLSDLRDVWLFKSRLIYTGIMRNQIRLLKPNPVSWAAASARLASNCIAAVQLQATLSRRIGLKLLTWTLSILDRALAYSWLSVLSGEYGAEAEVWYRALPEQAAAEGQAEGLQRRPSERKQRQWPPAQPPGAAEERERLSGPGGRSGACGGQEPLYLRQIQEEVGGWSGSRGWRVVSHPASEYSDSGRERERWPWDIKDIR